MRLAFWLAVGSMIVASATAAPPRSDDPRLSGTLAAATPEARVRFESLVAAYRALPAYSDQGEVVIVTQINEKSVRRVNKASVTFSPPNKLDVETEFVRVLSDGVTVTEVNVPLKKYRCIPTPKPFREAMLRGGPLGSIEFGGMAGLPLAHVLNLVIGHEPERLIVDFAPVLTVEPDQEVNGIVHQVLRFDEADRHDWRLLIDPRTGLIAYIDLAIEGDAAKSSLAGPAVHVTSIRWSAGVITTMPPDTSRFAFKLTPGMTPVAPLDAPRPADK